MALGPTIPRFPPRTSFFSTSQQDEDEEDQWPLHRAAASGDLSLTELLSQHPGNLNARHEFGLTPFHHAAASGHPDAVKLLADKNANLNPIDAMDKTLLLSIWSSYG